MPRPFLNFHFTAPTIGFELTSYTFDEGTVGEVCVTVSGVTENSPFLAVLAYVPNTASKSAF